MRDTVPRLPGLLWFRLTICALVAVPVLAFHNRGVLRLFENLLYDLRVRVVAPSNPTDDEIIILAIDNESLQRMEPHLGRWPWQRSAFAGILDYCSHAHAIGVDVLFTQRDWQTGGSDDILAETVGNMPSVVLPVFLNNNRIPQDVSGELEKFLLPAPIDSTQAFYRYRYAETPYPELLQVAPSLGHVNYLQDANVDGVVRDYLALVEMRGKLMPSLALEMARVRLGLDRSDIRLSGDNLLYGDHQVPLDGYGGLRVRYSFPSAYDEQAIPIADVFDSYRSELLGNPPLLDRSAFKDKVVFIGSTAVGLTVDRKVTPVDRAVDGVLINASAYESLVHQKYFRVVPDGVRIFLVALGLLLPALPRNVRPITMAGAFLIAFTAYCCIVFGAVALAGVMLPVTGPLVGLGISTGILSLMSWYNESAHRRRLEQLEGAKQRFTDMLVHDLKGQMAGVMMSLQMIDRKIVDRDDDSVKLVQTAQATGGRLLDRIHALLDIRRMQEGRMPLDRTPTTLGDVVIRCVDEYRVAGEIIGVGIRIEDLGALDRIPVSLDFELFQRILGNLLWNSMQYATKGTEVEIGGGKDGREVFLYVANLGRTIPVERQESIFLDFVSGKMGDKEHGTPSSGLGLSFCKLASEAHGGRIQIQSPWQENIGVKVTVTIPSGTDD